MQTTRTTAAAALALAGVLAASLFTGAAVATAARPPAQPTAVAVVDVPAILDGLNEKDRLEADLQTAIKDSRAKLEELTKEAMALQEELDPENGILKQGSPEYIRALGRLIELQSQAKARSQVLEQTLSLQQGEMLRTLYEKIEAAITKIADRQGYDIVLLDDSTFPLSNPAPFNQTQGEILNRSVIYAHDSTDITDDVVTLLNNEYQAP